MKTGKKLHKQTKIVEESMVKIGGKMMEDMAKQKKLLGVLEKREAKVSSDVEALRRRLSGRVESEDAESEKLKDRYFDAIATRDELNNAIMVTEESIAEAQTLYTRGLPEDDSVLGPYS